MLQRGSKSQRPSVESGIVPEVDQEGGQILFDASPPPLVDKSAVPDDPTQCVTVVAGLPRSWTSMMMQMLQRRGIQALTDGRREADSDNPKGYFELEAATRLRQDKDWLAGQRARSSRSWPSCRLSFPRTMPTGWSSWSGTSKRSWHRRS